MKTVSLVTVTSLCLCVMAGPARAEVHGVARIVDWAKRTLHVSPPRTLVRLYWNGREGQLLGSLRKGPDHVSSVGRPSFSFNAGNRGRDLVNAIYDNKNRRVVFNVGWTEHLGQIAVPYSKLTLSNVFKKK